MQRSSRARRRRPRRRPCRRGSCTRIGMLATARKKSDRAIAAWIFRSGGSPTWCHGPRTSGATSRTERRGAVIVRRSARAGPPGGRPLADGRDGGRSARGGATGGCPAAGSARSRAGRRTGAGARRRPRNGPGPALGRPCSVAVNAGCSSTPRRSVIARSSSFTRLAEAHVVAAVDVEERRHVERLVDPCLARGVGPHEVAVALAVGVVHLGDDAPELAVAARSTRTPRAD